MAPTFSDPLPTRVRVLVLGGGIHGVGILHDMASRGWHDIHLLEKDTVGAGTSSKSTKLIHGGLRYLRRIGDFGLVREALHERRRLMSLVPDLVQPIELLFPILRQGGMHRSVVKVGLSLYDRLAGRYRLESHRLLKSTEVMAKAPLLNLDKVAAVYTFWDAQTDDLGLVMRVAASARKLGAGISEGARAVRIAATDDGFTVDVALGTGEIRTISALYVVNALGPWANQLLECSGIAPTHQAINNKGSHLLCGDLGLKAGLFLQSTKGDGRIFFMLPWQGTTLIGTTEELHRGDPDSAAVSEVEIQYLLENCSPFLRKPLAKGDIKRVFAGLRWLAVESGHTLTETTRAYHIGERPGRRGLILTIYGGKLTTYRNLSRILGDRITRHFGEFHPSCTDNSSMWVPADETPVIRDPFQRFTDVV